MFRCNYASRWQAKTFNKVLIANRGEIACRIIKSCRAMSIPTVALYSEVEAGAKHVREADEAICIGPPPASKSYLRGERVVEIAKQLGADAIHPGYGFLSESPDFARSVTDAGIEFIGPPVEAISSMGSKSESKKIMVSAGVPVVPGYHGENQDSAFLEAEASRVGFPLLIKAVSGGGGKGMKIVRSKDDFATMLASAKREAVNYFKDDRVLLERYVEHPRHIECQVFCDKFGDGVFFFERDCSVQRRYQKVLEEAPAPHLSPEKRQQIGEVALRAAKAVGYVGAGTVEFLFDTSSDEIFFMEMNTRLQVEHPVTEEITRVKGQPLDLVRLQIETAAGKPLGFTQADVEMVGACVEARIYAESPQNDFLPGSGVLAYVQEPLQGVIGDVTVRLDTGFRSGDEVSIHFDPMIAKLIVWGKDRATALRGMRRSLDSYHIVGIKNNIEFLKRCCENEVFLQGGVTTKFIEQNKAELLRTAPTPTHIAALSAIAKLLCYPVSGKPYRVNSPMTVRIPLVVDGAPTPVDVTLVESIATLGELAAKDSAASTTFEVVVHHSSSSAAGGTSDFKHTICLSAPPASATSTRGGGGGGSHHGRVACYDAVIDNSSFVSLTAVVLENEVSLLLPTGTHTCAVTPLRVGFGDITYEAGGASRVVSPMPGKVAKFLVADGDTVKRGQNILVLEAMKMEHLIKAPADGVLQLNVKEGVLVMQDQLLAKLVVPDAPTS